MPKASRQHQTQSLITTNQCLPLRAVVGAFHSAQLRGEHVRHDGLHAEADAGEAGLAQPVEGQDEREDLNNEVLAACISDPLSGK